jgi:hypothetical protein
VVYDRRAALRIWRRPLTMPLSRPGPALNAAAYCFLVALSACSPEPAWQQRWELVTAGDEAVDRAATFGLSWSDTERTRGEFGMTFTRTPKGDGAAAASWKLRGTLTAKPLSPDFCGRAKWPPGSTCVEVTLWPRGATPPPDVQAEIERLGLPDRDVAFYLLFLDGRSNELALMRKSEGAIESRWRYVSAPT